ncbi:MAG: trypsin-like peptidase domain-containing protein [Planctomycetia bacterium]|nr:trypsin-like peptidase domain-containing protein [Planctomycetia bacterium]
MHILTFIPTHMKSMNHRTIKNNYTRYFCFLPFLSKKTDISTKQKSPDAVFLLPKLKYLLILLLCNIYPTIIFAQIEYPSEIHPIKNHLSQTDSTSFSSETAHPAKFSSENISKIPSPFSSEDIPSPTSEELSIPEKSSSEDTPIIAQAQPKEKVASLLDKPTSTSAQERDKLLQELQQHVAILEAQSNVLKLVAKIIAPSVVHIESITKIPPIRGSNTTIEEAGSGVIILRDDEYYIITNRHVIRGAKMKDIKIKLHDNRIIHPISSWHDSETDIAVLKVNAPDLLAAKIGNSNSLEIGDFVLAVGSPFGLNHSVTFGIISAKSRRSLEIGNSTVRLQDFLQTDAAINPGNSGGPLVNLHAEVVGINTAIASSSGGNEGIGFSIPIRMVMLIVDQLIKYGEVRRAYLGITLDGNFTQEKALAAGLPHVQGARVAEIQPGSPAAKANFSVGDIILYFNHVKVEDDKHLYNLVNLAESHKAVPVSVYRDGEIYNISIILQDKRR